MIYNDLSYPIWLNLPHGIVQHCQTEATSLAIAQVCFEGQFTKKNVNSMCILMCDHQTHLHVFQNPYDFLSSMEHISNYL